MAGEIMARIIRAGQSRPQEEIIQQPQEASNPIHDLLNAIGGIGSQFGQGAKESVSSILGFPGYLQSQASPEL